MTSMASTRVRTSMGLMGISMIGMSKRTMSMTGTSMTGTTWQVRV